MKIVQGTINVLKRILNILLKVVGFVLAVVLLVLVLTQLPPVQRAISSRLALELSEITRGEVSLESLKVSLSGHVLLSELKVCDPAGDCYFNLQSLDTKISFAQALRGLLVFNYVNIRGLDARLQNQDGSLNIQYLIDAFSSDQKSSSSHSVASGFDMYVGNILLDSIHFQFIAQDSATFLEATIDEFIADGVLVSVNPNIIEVNNASLNRSGSKIITKSGSLDDSQPDGVIDQFVLPYFDFYSNFEFNVGGLQMYDSYFSLHELKPEVSPWFDPRHLEIYQINLDLEDVILEKDSMNASINGLSARMPGFQLEDLAVNFSSNLTVLNVSDLRANTTASKINLNLVSRFRSWPELLEELNQASVRSSLKFELGRSDVSYFLRDSIVNQYPEILRLQGEITSLLNKNKLQIDKGVVSTSRSSSNFSGSFESPFQLSSLTWRTLEFNAIMGSDIRRLIKRFSPDLRLPPEIQIQVNSSGSVNAFEVDGKILSSWGNLDTKGRMNLESEDINLDLAVDGVKVDAGQVLSQDWLGLTDLSLSVKGALGISPNLDVDGLISEINIWNERIDSIKLSVSYLTDSVSGTVQILDPEYKAELESSIQYSGPLKVNAEMSLNGFRAGKLLSQDSTLSITGDFATQLISDQSSLNLDLDLRDTELSSSSMNYPIDLMAVDLLYGEDSTYLLIASSDLNGELKSNIQLQEIPNVVAKFLRGYVDDEADSIPSDNSAFFDFNFQVSNSDPFELVNLTLDDFSGLDIESHFNEGSKRLFIDMKVNRAQGYDVQIDSAEFKIDLTDQDLLLDLNISEIMYDTLAIGKLNMDLQNQGDRYNSKIILQNDSTVLLGLNSFLTQEIEKEIAWTLDSLTFLGRQLELAQRGPIVISQDKFLIDSLVIRSDSLIAWMNGSKNRFDLSLSNINLTDLNLLFDNDSLINSGHLKANLSYDKEANQIFFDSQVSDLRIYQTDPFEITAKAETLEDRIPFDFQISAQKNKVSLDGFVGRENEELDAKLLVDITHPDDFRPLISKTFDKISGSITGNVTLGGTFRQPTAEGFLAFNDNEIVTKNLRNDLYIPADTIYLNSSGAFLDDFSIYDKARNPLVLNGFIRQEDLSTRVYELRLNSDNFILFDNPADDNYQIQGILAVGADIALTGNSRNILLDAEVVIKDTSNVSIITASEDIELVTDEGIVEFYDPTDDFDSIAFMVDQSFYDSLISTLTNFNLNSRISLEQGARFKIVVDPRSGDYIDASGSADLELNFDRTGNVQLTGGYTIEEGYYKLSFYNIIQKEFAIAKGSRIFWNGDPYEGDLDLKALYTVKTSSLGLIGHEIGENEKATYRRTLPYEVSINIGGTIEVPEVSFALDLPPEDKQNYPALASKLNRLRQPEYETELNKQVFGLLVLGGFIPETDAANINEGVMASTTLANSVNSILAAQLNQLTSKYVKGVDIDVGIQSYSDFATGGGQTRTAMDFRVSKRVMNDRLSLEAGGSFDINADQSGATQGRNNFRGDIALIYDLTESGNKQLKAFNNETYDIIYHEVRNTGISLIFIKEFDNREDRKKKKG